MSTWGREGIYGGGFYPAGIGRGGEEGKPITQDISAPMPGQVEAGVAGAQIPQPALRFGERGLGPNYLARLITKSCKGCAWTISFPSLMTRGDEC